MPVERLFCGSYSTDKAHTHTCACAHTHIQRRERMGYRGLMEVLPLNHIPVGVLTHNISNGDCTKLNSTLLYE